MLDTPYQGGNSSIQNRTELKRKEGLGLEGCWQIYWNLYSCSRRQTIRRRTDRSLLGQDFLPASWWSPCYAHFSFTGAMFCVLEDNIRPKKCLLLAMHKLLMLILYHHIHGRDNIEYPLLRDIWFPILSAAQHWISNVAFYQYLVFLPLISRSIHCSVAGD